MMKKKSRGKNKLMKIIILFVFILVAVFIIFFVKKVIESRICDGPDMVNDAAVYSLDYNVSPDEYGRSESIYLNNGRIKYYCDEGTEGGSVKESCSVGDDLYDSLEDIIRKYDVRSWKDLEKSELEILDGSTISMKIQFADGTIICLGDDYEMPDGSWEAVSEITDLLESYLKENKSSVESSEEKE